MKQYQITQFFTAGAGLNQIDYHLPYDTKDTVNVTINGIPVSSKIVYDEDDGTRIIEIDENEKINNGDSVIVNVSKTSGTMAVVNSGNFNTPNTLYNKFKGANNDDTKLAYNNIYLMHLNIEGEIFENNFRTKLSPMFCTTGQIREDIGEFIPDYTDQYIESVIYQKSQEVIDLIDELANLEDPIENVTYTQDANGLYSTTYKAVKNWVRYSTDIQLIYAKYFGISYNYGSIKKNLGDITVERSTKLPYLDQLLEMFRKKLDEAEAYIRGTNIVSAFVKAGNTYSYEDWARTTNF